MKITATSFRGSKITLLTCIVSLILSPGASAMQPPPLQMEFPSPHAKSRSLEVIQADHMIQRGMESHDQGAEIDTSHSCKIVLDIWAGQNANGTLEVDGSPVSDLRTYQMFPETSPIDIKGPASGDNFSQQVRIVDSLHNYTWIYLRVSKGEKHGPIHVFATGIPCP